MELEISTSLNNSLQTSLKYLEDNFKIEILKEFKGHGAIRLSFGT